MINRELGMVEIRNRLLPIFRDYPLKRLDRFPTMPIVAPKDMPCLIILEGTDTIIKRSAKDYLGYPMLRELELMIECWDLVTGNARNLLLQTRVALLQPGLDLLTGVFFREERIFGPSDFGNPGVLAMRLYLKLTYTDEGI